MSSMPWVGRSSVPAVSRILASMPHCRASGARCSAARTASTYAGTHSVVMRTWSTQPSCSRPAALAAAMFSTIVPAPSENVEWTCMSWAGRSGMDGLRARLHALDLVEGEEALLEVADHRDRLERQRAVRERVAQRVVDAQLGHVDAAGDGERHRPGEAGVDLEQGGLAV